MPITQYPKWLYHATLPARVVDTYDEQDALGDEWVAHPSQLATRPAAESPETKVTSRKRK